MTLRSGREEIGIKKASRFDVGLFYAEVQKQFADMVHKNAGVELISE